MPTHKDLPRAQHELNIIRYRDFVENFIAQSNRIIENNLDEALALTDETGTGVPMLQVMLDIMAGLDKPAYILEHFEAVDTTLESDGWARKYKIGARHPNAEKFLAWLKSKSLEL